MSRQATKPPGSRKLTVETDKFPQLLMNNYTKERRVFAKPTQAIGSIHSNIVVNTLPSGDNLAIGSI